MTIICAWHKINWGFVLIMGEKEGEGVTDSICPACVKVMLECSNIKISELKEKRTSDFR